jgi:uncharacterized protein (DUF1778 family)
MTESATQTLSLRVPEDLLDGLGKAAEGRGVSRNAYVVSLFKRAVGEVDETPVVPRDEDYLHFLDRRIPELHRSGFPGVQARREADREWAVG